MAHKRCHTCGGDYDDVLPDGLRYFHTCPPLTEYLDDTGTRLSRASVEAIQKTGGRYWRRDVPRPNARDENVQRPSARGATATVKAEGLGATEIPPPSLRPLAGAELVIVEPPPA